MPLDPEALVAALDAFHDRYGGEAEVEVEAHEGDAFTLLFRGVGEGGRCADHHFTEVQWILKERERLDTQIVGGEWDEGIEAFRMWYEVVRWDG